MIYVLPPCDSISAFVAEAKEQAHKPSSHKHATARSRLWDALERERVRPSTPKSPDGIERLQAAISGDERLAA